MRKVSIFIFFNFFLFFFFLFYLLYRCCFFRNDFKMISSFRDGDFLWDSKNMKGQYFNFFLLIFSFTYFIYRCCFFSVRNAILLLGTDFRRDSKNAKASIFIFFILLTLSLLFLQERLRTISSFRNNDFRQASRNTKGQYFLFLFFFILFILFFYFTYFIVVDSLVPGQFLLSGTMIFGEERERLIFLFILFFFSFGTTNSNFQWVSIKQ